MDGASPQRRRPRPAPSQRSLVLACAVLLIAAQDPAFERECRYRVVSNLAERVAAVLQQPVPLDHDRFLKHYTNQLALPFPLLTGLVLGSPGAAAWLFVVAAALLFVANEPLVILLGARGKRLQQELRETARRQLVVLGFPSIHRQTTHPA